MEHGSRTTALRRGRATAPECMESDGPGSGERRTGLGTRGLEGVEQKLSFTHGFPSGFNPTYTLVASRPSAQDPDDSDVDCTATTHPEDPSLPRPASTAPYRLPTAGPHCSPWFPPIVGSAADVVGRVTTDMRASEIDDVGHPLLIEGCRGLSTHGIDHVDQALDDCSHCRPTRR